jgi:DUF4097 and DUF4098 domain-containing protein YvlB
MWSKKILFLAAAVALYLGLSCTAWAAANQFQKTDTYRNPAIKAGGSLSLTNLLGQVSLEPATDGVLQIDSTIVTVGASDQEAQTLAGKIRVEVSASGNAVTAVAHYPVDEYDEYYYPAEHNIFGITINNDSVRYEGARVHVSTGTFGSGINVHVDFVVHVPKGVRVAVDHKVGKITAHDLVAPLSVKTSSADLKTDNDTGDLDVDTGSGDLDISNQSGDLDIGTGSGDVGIEQQKGGNVHINTGSGDVKLSDLSGGLETVTGSGDVDIDRLNGDSIRLQTGSGEIDLSHANAKSINLRTGSGDMTLKSVSGSLTTRAGSGDLHATDFKAGEELDFHSGSGDVHVEGDLSAVTRLTADTGSGDITLRTAAIPSLHISATSDSGDVNVDLPGLEKVSARAHTISGDVNGAKGVADMESGSGDINFTH